MSPRVYIVLCAKILVDHVKLPDQLDILKAILDGTLESRKRNYDELCIKSEVEIDIESLKPGCTVFDKVKFRYVLIVSTHPEILGFIINPDKSVTPGEPVKVQTNNLIRSVKGRKIIRNPLHVIIPEEQRQELLEVLSVNV